MALRQTTGFVESLLRLIGLDWGVPDFSTLSRRQKTLKVNIPYRGSDGPLHLLVDSTGIKVEGEGSGTRASMAAPNVGSGARSTSGSTRKAWKSVRQRSPPATWATRRCCPSFLTRSRPSKRSPASQPTAHLTPASAMMPSPPVGPLQSSHPRKNAKPWKPDPAGAIARTEILRTSKRVGRTIWRRWSGSHRRSRAETKMHCVKLLGQALVRSGLRPSGRRGPGPCPSQALSNRWRSPAIS